MWIIKSMILLFLFGQYGGQAFTIGELTPIKVFKIVTKVWILKEVPSEKCNSE